MALLLEDLIQRSPPLEACRDTIAQSYDLLADSFAGGGKLLLCCNGGSAADAEHWAGELLKGFLSPPPPEPWATPGPAPRNWPRSCRTRCR